MRTERRNSIPHPSLSLIRILLVLVVSTVSRSVRATELRVSEADFIDQASAAIGPSLVGKQVHMVP